MSSRSQRPAESENTSTTLLSTLQRLIRIRGGLSALIAIAGAAAMLLGLILLLFIPELRGSAYIVLVFGSVLLLFSLMVSFNTVRQSISGRRGRYGTNTAIMIAAAVTLGTLSFVLVELINIERLDLTATRQFTLAPQSLDILNDLSEPVQVIAFFVPDDPRQELFRIDSENRLNEFEHRSDNKLEYRFVDPDREPTLANRYRISEYPTIVFEGQESGRQHRLTAPQFAERDFASALLIVTGVERKLIYYLTGHGERDYQDTELGSHEGFGLAISGMFGDNYSVIPLSLVQNPGIPGNPAAIVIAGPTRDLDSQEYQIVFDYLKDGGRILLLLEPDPPQTFKDLLASWAVEVEEGIVVDLGSSLSGQPQTPLIQRAQYNTNEPVGAITSLVEQSYFPGTASFVPSFPPEEMPATITQYPVALTTVLSCLTLDVTVTDCPDRDFGARVPVLAVQGIAPLGGEPNLDVAYTSKIVVFGDVDFATNFHINSVGNRDLVLNSVNWLTEDFTLASVRPKAITSRELVVTGREMQIIRALSWLVLPSLMAIFAGVAWWRRR